MISLIVKITFIVLIVIVSAIFVYETFIKRIIDYIKTKKEEKNFWHTLTRGDNDGK